MVEEASPCNTGANPYLAFRFRVEIDGLEVCSFNEVKGLTSETETENFREGGLNTHEHQLTGPTKHPSKLVLKRGLADVQELWNWYKDVAAGRIERKKVAIVLMNSAGSEKWRWTFQSACPIKWSGPEFRANSADIAFESIELIHKGFVSAAK